MKFKNNQQKRKWKIHPKREDFVKKKSDPKSGDEAFFDEYDIGHKPIYISLVVYDERRLTILQNLSRMWQN